MAMAAKIAPAPRPPACIEEAAPLKEATVVLAAPAGLTPEVLRAKPLDGPLVVVAPVAYGALKPMMSALKMLTASLPTLLR